MKNIQKRKCVVGFISNLLICQFHPVFFWNNKIKPEAKLTFRIELLTIIPYINRILDEKEGFNHNCDRYLLLLSPYHLIA